MIAKGLDFPNVTLVGVINADIGLNFPDFRSAERTFQLLSQVSGRTGRGARGGKVLIQTFNPEHPSIALAATHDYASFVAIEMGHRQAHNYPPYNRLIRLIVRSRDQNQAGAFAERLATGFQSALERLRSPEMAAASVRCWAPQRRRFQAQGLLSVPLPASVGQRCRPASIAPHRATRRAAPDGRRVHARRRSVDNALMHWTSILLVARHSVSPLAFFWPVGVFHLSEERNDVV